MMLANNFPSDLDSSGQTITFDEKTEFKSHVDGVESIADITADSSLEIRGFTTASGSFYATQIVVNKAVTSTQDILRVRGIIDTLSYSSFRVGRLDVYFDHHTTFVNLESRVILPGMAVVMVGAFEDETNADNNNADNNIAIGDYSRNNAVNNSHNSSRNGFSDNSFYKNSKRIFRATSIEVLNLDVLYSDPVELEGFIGANGVANQKFSINDITVQFTSVTFTRYGDLSKLSAGVKVEVSGIIDRQGVLVAENIEIEQQQNYSLTGSIEAIHCREINSAVTPYSESKSSESKSSESKSSESKSSESNRSENRSSGKKNPESNNAEDSLTVMATTVVIDGNPGTGNVGDAASSVKSTVASTLKAALAKLAIHDSIKIKFHKNTQTGLYVLDSMQANNNRNGLAKVTGPISSVYSHAEKTLITIAGVRTRIAMTLLESAETELRPGLILELSGRYCSTEAVFHVNDYIIKD